MPKLSATFLLVLLFNISCSYAETYYVDSLKGKDTNNGLQPSTAIKTLRKASQLKLNAGDKLLLSNEHEFNGSLAFKNIFGEKNNPIVISSYPNKSKAKNTGLLEKI